MRSMDAVQAFVQSDIDGDVYLYSLDGYHDLPGKVLKLKMPEWVTPVESAMV